MSIHFLHFLRMSLSTRKNTPKNIFHCVLRQKFQQVTCRFWVCFQWLFNVCCWNLERKLPDNQAKKHVGELLCRFLEVLSDPIFRYYIRKTFKCLILMNKIIHSKALRKYILYWGLRPTFNHKELPHLHPRQKNIKNCSGHITRGLMTELGQAGEENTWLLIIGHDPHYTLSVHPDLKPMFCPPGSPNYYEVISIPQPPIQSDKNDSPSIISYSTPYLANKKFTL